MNIDIKTLLLSNLLIYIFLSLLLVYFKIKQKTYSGFTYWMIGTFCATIGNIGLAARTLVPVGLSIMTVNLFYGYAAILRLDGTVQFLHDRRINKWFYLIPLLVSIPIGYYYFFDDRISLRNLLLALIIVPASWKMAYELILHSPASNKILFWFAGWLNFLFGCVILVRALLWMSYPDQDIFESNLIQIMYFLSIQVFEICWVFSFLMMNNQRLELEFRETQTKLLLTIRELEEANIEIKTLSGLLPICSFCKKVRDDKGYWNQIEVYLHEHSDARFSHGICPDCVKKHYAEYSAGITDHNE